MPDNLPPSSPPPGNAAIYYEPEGFSTDRKALMGRHAATEGFLKGFVRYADVDHFYGYARNEPAVRDFAARVRAMGGNQPITWLRWSNPTALAETGCVMRYDAVLDGLAWRRRRVDQRAYSLCGVTHTISGGGLDPIIALLTAPVQEWDALICTSTAVRDAVAGVLGEQADYLRARLGTTRTPLPRLPVIPLGVDTGAVAPSAASAGTRAAWRERLGIGPNDMAALFVGRLSFHAKANPLPMYLALERVARRSGRRLHLIQAGWFANEHLERAFRDSAAAACPSVAAVFVDGRLPAVRQEIWSAADLFLSLSDNVQETFGLTPIEAMAAGLPVVVTDWDGYRDTVRDGIDGFRVPTMTPPVPLGGDLADRFAVGLDTYDQFCGYSSLFVAVDTDAAAEAIHRLVADADLRRRMGEAGRQRARDVYDWSVVIPQYQDLWRELAECRRGAAESAPPTAGRQAHPARPDPFAAFAGYPTDIIGLDHEVTLAEAEAGAGAENGAADAFAARAALPIAGFAPHLMPREEVGRAVLAHLAATGPCGVRDLLELVPPPRRPELLRGLVTLYKLALIRIRAPRPEA